MRVPLLTAVGLMFASPAMAQCANGQCQMVPPQFVYRYAPAAVPQAPPVYAQQQAPVSCQSHTATYSGHHGWYPRRRLFGYCRLFGFCR